MIISLPWLRAARAQGLLDGTLPTAVNPASRSFDLVIVDEPHHVAPSAPKQPYAVDSQQISLIRGQVPHCLRALHRDIDQAVFDAYGWTDLDPAHDHVETRQGIRWTIDRVTRHGCSTGSRSVVAARDSETHREPPRAPARNHCSLLSGG